MKISVIVPVFCGGLAFRACIDALTHADPAPEEIIVVSDASPDDSDYVAQDAGVRLIRLPSNAGPSRARNVGAASATGNILLFIDADVSIPTTLIDQIQTIFDQPDAPDAVFGSYDAAPAERNFTSQYRNLLHHYVHQTSRESATTFWAGCGAIRRDVFLKMDGFPENRRWLEDIELGYRLTAAGYSIRLVKSLQVKHLKRWALRSMVITDVFHRALPWTELLYQYKQSTLDLNLRQSSRLSALLVCLLPVLLVLALIAPSLWAVFCLVVVACVVGLTILNADILRFFYRERGCLFMCRAAGYYALYYFYSTLGYLLGTLKHYFSIMHPPRLMPAQRQKAN